MKRLIKNVTGLDVTDRAATTVVIMFAATVAIGALAALGALIYALFTGRLVINSAVSAAFLGVVIVILNGLQPVISAYMHRIRSEINQQRNEAATNQAINRLETKLQNGLGDKIAGKTANKVAEQVAELKAASEQPWTGEERRQA